MRTKHTLIATAVVIVLTALLYFEVKNVPDSHSGVAAASNDLEPSPPLPVTPASSAEVSEFKSASTIETTGADFLENFCVEYDVNNVAEDAANKLSDVFQNLWSETKNQLTQSTQSDHLYVAAMMEEDKAERLTLIKRAIEADPQNKHSYRLGLTTCMYSPVTQGCQNKEWEKRLVELDRENSEAWMMVAANRYHHGDTQAAYEALEQAASAEDSTIYWVHNIELATQVLEAGGIKSFSHRAQAAIALSLVPSPAYSRYIVMCREQSNTNPAWAQACLTYGERSAQLSATLLGESIARVIQIQAHKALGNEQIAQELEDLQTMRKVEYSTNSVQQKEMHLAFAVPELFYAYLDLLRSHGELGAIKLVRNEISQYVENNPNRACETLLQESSLE